MTSSAHIVSATLHAGDLIDGGSGAPEVSMILRELVGDRFVVARITREGDRSTLIIDASWIGLAESLVDSRQDLIEVNELQGSVVLATIAGWPDDWEASGEPVTVDMTDDGLPQLRPVLSRIQPA